MAAGPPPDTRPKHPRESPPANGASRSHVGVRRKRARTLSPVAQLARPALIYAQLHADRFVQDLLPFLRFPSISSALNHRASVRQCAEWLAGHLKKIGLPDVRVVATQGHPIVVAASQQARDRPTLLVYGHYDVQPVDPLSNWKTPPFSPVRRSDELIARGASDDKGQLFLHIKAFESYLASGRSLPVNVKCVFEGEEEVGSPHFAAFLRAHRDTLAADCAVVSDTRMASPQQPAIIYGQRGMLSAELFVRTLRHDVHSGAFGGAVRNAAQVLAEILAQLHSRNCRVQIPGFYDQVGDATSEEREYFRNLAPGAKQMLMDSGAARGWGERNFSLFERTTIRPALTINGIKSGYQGSGGKGIIPAGASAKISIRLVPDQDPAEIERQLRDYLKQLIPKGVHAHLRVYSRARPVLMSPAHPANRAAAFAYGQAFETSPVFLRSGGTIGVVNHLREILKVPVTLMGFALPDDRMHAPNEKLHLPTFHRGVATSIWFMAALARIQKRIGGGVAHARD